MADIEFTLTNNFDLIRNATEDAIITALRAVGSQAADHVVAQITANGSVDTGRLRNSITFTVSGDPAKEHKYSDDQNNSYSDHIDAAGEKKDYIAYIGTNVEYAEAVENGHVQEVGRFIPGYWKGKGADARFIYDPTAKTGMVLKEPSVKGRPFLRKGITNGIPQYQAIFEQELTKLSNK